MKTDSFMTYLQKGSWNIRKKSGNFFSPKI